MRNKDKHPSVTKDIKSYFRAFVEKHKLLSITLKKDLQDIDKKIEDVKFLINTLKDNFSKYIKVDITKTTEYINLTKSFNDSLRKKCENYIKTSNKKGRNLAVQGIKLCKYIEERDNILRKIDKSNFYKSINFNIFSDIFATYTNHVSKFILQGYGYKINNSIGVIYAQLFATRKAIVDFKKTKEAKLKLIEQGIEPYDYHKELYCKKNNIPYNGVKYTVYKNEDVYAVLQCHLLSKGAKLTFVYQNELAYKYRNLNREELAIKYGKRIETLYDFPCTINQKINLFIKADEKNKLNFVRDEV